MVAASTATKPKVLVVEDETDIRDLLTFNLRQQGYDVAAAESGSAALDELGSVRA